MAAAAVLELLLFGAALAVFAIGAAMAWTSANVVKRLAGMLIGMGGAGLAALTLGAPQTLALAALGVALAQLMLGAAIAVRLQEAYAGLEARDLDSADAQAEPAD